MIFKKKTDDPREVELFECEEDDIVEVLIDGEFKVGEVVSYESHGKKHMYISLLDTILGVASLDDPTVRRSANANKNAVKAYRKKIVELEDEINHTYEKNKIKVLQEKITKATGPDTEEQKPGEHPSVSEASQLTGAGGSKDD